MTQWILIILKLREIVVPENRNRLKRRDFNYRLSYFSSLKLTLNCVVAFLLANASCKPKLSTRISPACVTCCTSFDGKRMIKEKKKDEVYINVKLYVDFNTHVVPF